ncbi:MAG TPA: ribosome small subunit-dependent GTPase A [Actinocrinis sp.]|nr:ribosome small subunit-dependent GTPase A [Actinocrinis sp.]
MVRRGRDFDEDDVRIRANPRGTRPRSRLRPGHEDAADAMVIAVDRGRYTCLISDRDGDREIVAMKARELGRKGVVVGDLRGGPDSLGRVVRVHPRAHVLRRTADDTDPVERVIVANADQLVIVTALADPEPRPRMIDRCLVAAYDAGLNPVLCLTKADLADPAPLLAAYEPLGVTAIVTSSAAVADSGGATDAGGAAGSGADAQDDASADLGRLREVLAGRVSVLVGHSGVGKSTLVNRLVPDADRAIGEVNDVTGRGRHTSTSAVALRLPDAAPESGDPDGPDAPEGPGWVIDTPGVRSFGLAHVGPDTVIAAFPDLAEVTAQCPRGCTHAADAPDCALDDWLAGFAGDSPERAVAAARVDSVRRLLAALSDRDRDRERDRERT